MSATTKILPLWGRWQPEGLTEGCNRRRGYPSVAASRRHLPLQGRIEQ
jgi:hypothetical protein